MSEGGEGCVLVQQRSCSNCSNLIQQRILKIIKGKRLGTAKSAEKKFISTICSCLSTNIYKMTQGWVFSNNILEHFEWEKMFLNV